MTEAERNIFNKALVEYGISSQKMMAIEECAELTNALAKLARGRVSQADIITELADVSIMVDQLALFFLAKTLLLKSVIEKYAGSKKG